MRKILSVFFSLMLAASPILADKRITGSTSYQVVGRGLTWASTVNNNFILDVISPSTGMCLQVTNNDVGAHSYTVTAFETSDIYTTTYTGNTGKWNQVTVSPGASNTTAASSTDQLYITTTGAAHVVISILGGVGAGTADIVIAQTPNFCGQGATVPGCSKSAVVQVASALSAILIPAPPVGQFNHICSYQTSGSVVTSASLTFANGSAGACGALGLTIWQLNAATGNSPSMLAIPYPNQIFQTTVAAQPLCINNGGTGAIQTVSVSYSVF